MCPSRHPIYLILLSLGVMPRVPTALHLLVTYIDDITRPIAICNDTHKFVAYRYSTLQEFVVDNKVMVTTFPRPWLSCPIICLSKLDVSLACMVYLADKKLRTL